MESIRQYLTLSGPVSTILAFIAYYDNYLSVCKLDIDRYGHHFKIPHHFGDTRYLNFEATQHRPMLVADHTMSSYHVMSLNPQHELHHALLNWLSIQLKSNYSQAPNWVAKFPLKFTNSQTLVLSSITTIIDHFE